MEKGISSCRTDPLDKGTHSGPVLDEAPLEPLEKIESILSPGRREGLGKGLF